MEVSKQIRIVGSGKDQLGKEVGSPRKGDIVHIHYVGYYYVKNGKRKKEFDDTYHECKMKKFTIGAGATTNHEIPEGLQRAVQAMKFGETARVELAASVAYGSKGYKGYCGKVPPDQDVVFDSLGLVKLQRGDTVHARVPVNNAVTTGCCGYGFPA